MITSEGLSNASFKSDALTQAPNGGWIVHMEFEEYADANQVVSVGYSAVLRAPYETMAVDFKITPRTPVELIRVKMSVVQQGAIN